MVSADEQRGKGPGLQPVQPPMLCIAAIPDAAEVSTDDEVILFGQVTLLMECRRQEPAEITVRITLSRCKNYSDVCYKTVEIANYS